METIVKFISSVSMERSKTDLNDKSRNSTSLNTIRMNKIDKMNKINFYTARNNVYQNLRWAIIYV